MRHAARCPGIALAAGLALQAAAASAEERSPIKLLRQDEDWTAFCSRNAPRSAFDRLKCIRPDGGLYPLLSLGGEIRQRYEYTRNPVWGEDPQDGRGVWLHRYVLHGDLRLSPNLRLFGQLSSALEAGRAGPPTAIDRNSLDVQQAFIEASGALGAGELMARLGRQELRYGSARLIDVREGPNVRRKFDGAALSWRSGDWRVDGLLVQPSRLRVERFDDDRDRTQALWGVYATGAKQAWLPFGSSLDVYYLGYRNDRARFDRTRGEELRHTVGARIFGQHAGFDWNWEAMAQRGDLSGATIRAWSVATETGYTLAALPWTQRLGLGVNAASGDRRAGDRRLGTFNPLFPRGNYFSELALLGPRNFWNLQPSLTLTPHPDLSLSIGGNFFWRLEREDGVCRPGGALLRSGEGSNARYVGTELSLNATWQATPNVALSAVYSRFWPGRFIRETGPAREIDFVEFTIQARGAGRGHGGGGRHGTAGRRSLDAKRCEPLP